MYGDRRRSSSTRQARKAPTGSMRSGASVTPSRARAAAAPGPAPARAPRAGPSAAPRRSSSTVQAASFLHRTGTFRHRMRRALGGIAAVVVLTGCGGNKADEANHYVDAVNRAQSQFAGTLDRLSGRISATSRQSADRRVLRSFDTAVSRVVGRLRGITPPGDVTGLHRKLVGEMDAYGQKVRHETATLRSNDPRRLVAAQQRLLSATDDASGRINATISAINRRLGAR